MFLILRLKSIIHLKCKNVAMVYNELYNENQRQTFIFVNKFLDISLNEKETILCRYIRRSGVKLKKIIHSNFIKLIKK